MRVFFVIPVVLATLFIDVGAFCASNKRKAINAGTKISDVTENTLIDKDCETAYFGCMDTFCMSENVSGGRCKCNDKNAQFDEIFEKIQAQNHKNYLVQTEAIALLKMGKNANDVYAMTDALTKFSKAKKQKSFVSSGLNAGLFGENEDDEDFEDDDFEIAERLSNKSGDELHVAVANLCSQRIPEKCLSTLNMLRSLYVNKIQSDCVAYENSLKQSQEEMNTKLTETKRSLRDVALEKYQSENKYDLGGCVSEYMVCMQKENTCGEEYANCVSLAANDRLKNKTVKLQSEKTGIRLAASTFDQLLSKRPLCDDILEQCVKVKDQVWDEFLLRAAPTIAMAEFNAESDLRQNCIADIAECFREKCKSPFKNQNAENQKDKKSHDESYDDCLTDPELYKSLCKPQLEPCLQATGGDYEHPTKSSLWGYVVAKLAAMKLGACTREVRQCLLADDACGADYANCIGMTVDAIGRLCDFRKLTACMTENKNDEYAVRQYIAQVGQGIALEINTKMITNCENALKTAMVTYCGAENGCPNATIDANIFKNMMSVEFCNDTRCETDLSKFDDYKDILAGKVSPQIKGNTDLVALQYSVPSRADETKSNDNDVFFIDSSYGQGDDSLSNIVTILNSAYADMIKSIESDPNVNFCMYGRNTRGISSSNWVSKASTDDVNYPSLTNGTRSLVAQHLLNGASEAYYSAYEEKVSTEVRDAVSKISSALTRLKGTLQEAQKVQQVINETVCKRLTYNNKPGSLWVSNGYWDNKSSYDKFSSICTVKITRYTKGGWGPAFPFEFDWSKTKKYQLPVISQEDMEKAGGNIGNVTTSEDDIINNTLDSDAKLSD